MVKNHLALGVLLILVSCGQSRGTLTYGVTTKSALLVAKGQPLSTSDVPQGEVLEYEKEKYQLRDGVLVAGFRAPQGDEVTMLFWKHKFKGLQTEVRELPTGEKELVCDSLGLSIVYSEGSAFVSRVVEYEKK